MIRCAIGLLSLVLTGHPCRYSHHKSYVFIRQQLNEVLDRHFQGHQQIACYLNNDIGSKIVTALACRSFPGSTSSFMFA